MGEYKYNSTCNGHVALEDGLAFTNFSNFDNNTKDDSDDYLISTTMNAPYSPKDFKKNMNVRLCLKAPTGVTFPYTVYLESIQLFKVVYDDNGKIIPPLSLTTNTEPINPTPKTTYYYFNEDDLGRIVDADSAKPTAQSKKLTWDTYKPLYNDGAQKVRVFSIKESNYFNILQSLAEMFEAWLDIYKDNTGKQIKFKKYVGQDRVFGFKYGVNLKDIQRTTASKDIVTKLIVKQNNNEFGKDGFCTIARAGVNPTGENYIYDFSYFINKGLINANEFISDAYTDYYPTIASYNSTMKDNNDTMAGIAKNLLKLRADYEVASAGAEAANSGIEEVQDRFEKLTGLGVSDIGGTVRMSVEDYPSTEPPTSFSNVSDTISKIENSRTILYSIEEELPESPTSESGDDFWTKEPSNAKWQAIKGTDGWKTGKVGSFDLLVFTVTGTEVDIVHFTTTPTITITTKTGQTKTTTKDYECSCLLTENDGAYVGTTNIVIYEVGSGEREDINNLLTEYVMLTDKYNRFTTEASGLNTQIENQEKAYNTAKNQIVGLRVGKGKSILCITDSYEKFCVKK